MGDLGDGGAASCNGLTVHGVGVLDVEAEEAGGRRPLRPRVEQHHHRIADSYLRMRDASVLTGETSELFRVEGPLHVGDELHRVARDDPRRHGGVALGNRLDGYLLPPGARTATWRRR